MELIGDTIKALRIERGWTRRYLAEHTGFIEGTIYRWENNLNRPSRLAIHVLEQVFGEEFNENVKKPFNAKKPKKFFIGADIHLL